MQTVCLVTAPTISDFADPEVTLGAHKQRQTQLGILCLAASIRSRGHRPIVIDLDRITIDVLRRAGHDVLPDELFVSFVDALSSVNSSIFGFSTICGSYPLTIRLARAVKELHPDALIILGGPQASVVDTATLDEFPWVDLVVRGEADHTFPALLDALDHSPGRAGVFGLDGITARRKGRAERGPAAPLVADLDLLPLPAYDLDPAIATRRTAHLELGRGCPYACTFCSTNDFFRRRFRLKSTNGLLTQMRELHGRYGVSAFTLVHDMYTVDRKRVVEFCEAIIDSGESFEWSCSARTDRVDAELLTLMADAGCRGIFFGIETGSEELQRSITKRLDLAQAWNAVRTASDCGMTTAVALILGFPDETRDDLRATIHFFFRSTRLDHAEPQISLLAPLADTPIEREYRGRLEFDHIFSNMSSQGWRNDPDDLKLIEAYPAIFPNFYTVPALLPRPYVREVQDFAHGMELWFRWLPAVLLDVSGDILAVFDEWVAWHVLRHRDRKDAVEAPTGQGHGRDSQYYCTNTFADDVLTFVAEALGDGRLPNSRLLASAIEYERALFDLPRPTGQEEGPLDGVRATPDDRLALGPNVIIRVFQFDVANMLDSIRHENNTRGAVGPNLQQSTVAFVVYRGRPTRIFQLSPHAADLVLRCDGEQTIATVLDGHCDRYCSENAAPRDREVCKRSALHSLTNLYEDDVLILRESEECGASVREVAVAIVLSLSDI